MSKSDNKIKVNVWQMGYTTFKDYACSNKYNTKCVDKGYVFLDNLDNHWEETIWHLLNWGCWNIDDDGNAIKPESVQSPLDHCNSDVILNIDGTNIYKYAKSFGFGEATSLEEAIKKMVDDFCNFWPFPDVKRTSGAIRQKDDKVFQCINDKWVEITW
jgi:hypothetical protein